MIFGVLLLATALVVAGYLVLHFSTQAQGQLKSFGKYLSYWVFLFAAAIIIGVFVAPSFGFHPFGMRMMMRDRAMMGDHDQRHQDHGQMRQRGTDGMMERPIGPAPGTVEPPPPPPLG